MKNFEIVFKPDNLVFGIPKKDSFNQNYYDSLQKNDI